MEAALLAALAALPNFAFAAFTIIRQDRTITTLLDNQQKLIDQLMALHPPQSKEDAKNIVA